MESVGNVPVLHTALVTEKQEPAPVRTATLVPPVTPVSPTFFFILIVRTVRVATLGLNLGAWTVSARLVRIGSWGA